MMWTLVHRRPQVPALDRFRSRRCIYPQDVRILRDTVQGRLQADRVGLEHQVADRRAGDTTILALRDDRGRILAVANFNNDIGDFWEWSDEGFYPIDLSNEAYKFGVNYVVYAMTH